MCRPRRVPLGERFWSYVTKSDGCWLWTGKTNRRGYGVIYTDYKDGRTTYELAHRVAHKLHIGPIPEAAQVLHSCDIRNCVNPAHLRVGTHAENMHDMAVRERNRKATRFATHCGRGHLLDEANAIPRKGRPKGGKICRECRNEAYRRYRRRHQAKQCPQGHPYEGDNVYWQYGPGKGPRCRICSVEAQRKRFHSAKQQAQPDGRD